MDWGYARPFSVGWYAVDSDRRLYRIREYYGCTGTPNQGVKMEPTHVAREIKRIESEDPNLRGKNIMRVGDPAIWGSQMGESIGDLMERERVYFNKGDHSRIDGKMQVHHRLTFDDDGRPMLYVFNTCRHFIRTVPNLVYDGLENGICARSARDNGCDDENTSVRDNVRADRFSVCGDRGSAHCGR